MIVEAAILGMAWVVVTAIRSAERIHKRTLDAEAALDLDVAEARRILERDREEWLRVASNGARSLEDRQKATNLIRQADEKLLKLAGVQT